jgi:hypothetical protein
VDIPAIRPNGQLVRRVRVVRGQLPLEMECRPAFAYARGQHTTVMHERGVRFDGPGLTLGLAASVQLRRDGDGAVATFSLSEGQSATFGFEPSRLTLTQAHARADCPTRHSNQSFLSPSPDWTIAVTR